MNSKASLNSLMTTLHLDRKASSLLQKLSFVIMACRRSIDCTCAECAAANAAFSIDDLKQFSSKIDYGEGEQNGDSNPPETEPPVQRPPKRAPKRRPKQRPTQTDPMEKIGEFG